MPSRRRPWLALVALGWPLGCVVAPAPVGESASRGAPGASWSFFAPAPDDVWSSKVGDWQERQRRDRPALAERTTRPVLNAPDWALLEEKSDAFQRRERRALAARITAFSQQEARSHYRWDPETDLAADPWPTSLELYERNGDDCDGLDLIAYDLLRAFGFPSEELYRVILRRESDAANHMATLWFEERDDPWVIDATGAVTRRMRRFSDLRGWTPLRVFDEEELWGVAPEAAVAP